MRRAEEKPALQEQRKSEITAGQQAKKEEDLRVKLAEPGVEKSERSAAVIHDTGKPWDGKVKKQENKKPRRHSPAQLEELIAKVDLRLREQEAMLSWLDKQISVPENHLDLEKSKAMAAEREEYVKTIDELVQKWEELLEEQDLLEQEEQGN